MLLRVRGWPDDVESGDIVKFGELKMLNGLADDVGRVVSHMCGRTTEFYTALCAMLLCSSGV